MPELLNETSEKLLEHIINIDKHKDANKCGPLNRMWIWEATKDKLKWNLEFYNSCTEELIDKKYLLLEEQEKGENYNERRFKISQDGFNYSSIKKHLLKERAIDTELKESTIKANKLVWYKDWRFWIAQIGIPIIVTILGTIMASIFA
jgi:hypothetical protein